MPTLFPSHHYHQYFFNIFTLGTFKDTKKCNRYPRWNYILDSNNLKSFIFLSVCVCSIVTKIFNQKSSKISKVGQPEQHDFLKHFVFFSPLNYIGLTPFSIML
jgi:hypothetical protein